MPKNAILIVGVSVLALVGLLDRVAYWYHLYFYIRWFDCLMHFLGGISIGLLAAYIFYSYFRKINALTTKKQVFLVALLPVLAIGLVWELFEFGTDRFAAAQIHLRSFQRIENKWTDNASDLVFDVLGGVYASMILISLGNKKQNNGEES